MPVTITIHGENAGEALKELGGMTALIGAPVATATVAVAEASDKPARSTTSKRTQPPKVEPNKPEPAQEDQPAAAPEEPGSAEPVDEGGDAEPAPDVTVLRAKAQEIGSTPERKRKIKELLDKYECPNITAVPEAKRAAFLKELEAIQ